jgi:hypothetical protein
MRPDAAASCGVAITESAHMKHQRHYALRNTNITTYYNAMLRPKRYLFCL